MTLSAMTDCARAAMATSGAWGGPKDFPEVSGVGFRVYGVLGFRVYGV